MSDLPKIIGIDPGETTGVAVWDWSELLTMQLVPLSVTTILSSVIRADTLVVCERFVIGRNTVRKRVSSTTSDIIGRVRALCEKVDARFKLQSSSDAKNFAVNDMLRRIGWYQPGQRHAMDAARHALLALAREWPHEFDRMMQLHEA